MSTGLCYIFPPYTFARESTSSIISECVERMLDRSESEPCLIFQSYHRHHQSLTKLIMSIASYLPSGVSGTIPWLILTVIVYAKACPWHSPSHEDLLQNCYDHSDFY